MRKSILLMGLGALLPAVVSAQAATPPSQPIRQNVDSGYLDNHTTAAKVVFRKSFRYAGSTWLQLRFAATSNLPQGSILRIRGAKDNVEQKHNGASLVDYSYWSAGFNGEEIVVELVAGPDTRANRVKIEEVVRGLPAVATPTSICGSTDDRTRSNDPRQGRLWQGCTGWLAGIINGGTRNLMLTAGHCPVSTPILELNVPLSTSSGSVVRAHPDDQYPFTRLAGLNGGIGADWQVCSVGANSNTNRLPTDANGGQFYNLGPVPSSTSGQNITITGYGTTSPRAQPSQVQKIHTGPLSQILNTALCYATDTTGGNSGSPVIHANTGNVIGIHTHAGCTSTGGCNRGTRIDRSDLRAAIDAAIGARPGSFSTFGTGCPGGFPTFASCNSINGNGGTLTQSTAENEYAYIANTSQPLNVTGFEIYSQSAGGSPQTVTARIYAASGSEPGAQLASGTITIGGAAGFYRANLSATVPAGRFFVAVDHSAQTTYLANLSGGTAAGAYWRRGTGAWRQSGIIRNASFRVICSGAGSSKTVPVLSNTGLPRINDSFSLNLTKARPNAPAVLMLGASRTNWRGFPLPFSLAVIGAPGCNLLQSANVTVGTGTGASGGVSLNVNVPNQATLVGARGFCQFYVIDAGNNAAGLSVSNAGDATIGG